MSNNTFDEFDVYVSRSYLLVLDLLAIVFSLLAIFFIMKADCLAGFGLSIYGADDPYFFWIFGWIIFVLAALISFPIFTSMFIYPVRIFSVSDDGFWSIFYGFIKWNNLKSIGLLNLYCLSFVLMDSNFVGQTLFARFIYSIFRKPCFKICFWGTNANVNDIYKFCKDKIESV